MDISQARIRRFITHSVGNKLRDEGIVVSNEATGVDESVASIILRNYLGGIRNSDTFRFFHESDTNLNEIKVFSEAIFGDDVDFITTSEKIAKHLYSKSTHPGVSSGDLFIVLFAGISIDEQEYEALGIFKTETKDDFLSVYEDNGALRVRGSIGIDPRNLQKAAIIPAGCDFLFAFERGSSTAYWLDEFLKVQKLPTKKSVASYVARLVKETVREIGEPQTVANYQEELNRVLAVDTPTVSDIFDAARPFVGPEKTAELRRSVDAAMGLTLEPDYILEQKSAYRAAANAFKRIPIASGVELLLSTRISSKAIRTTYSSDRRVVAITIEMEEAK